MYCYKCDRNLPETTFWPGDVVCHHCQGKSKPPDMTDAETQHCNFCNRDLPIKSFYPTNRTQCRSCLIRRGTERRRAKMDRERAERLSRIDRLTQEVRMLTARVEALESFVTNPDIALPANANGVVRTAQPEPEKFDETDAYKHFLGI